MKNLNLVTGVHKRKIPMLGKSMEVIKFILKKQQQMVKKHIGQLNVNVVMNNLLDKIFQKVDKLLNVGNALIKKNL